MAHDNSTHTVFYDLTDNPRQSETFPDRGSAEWRASALRDMSEVSNVVVVEGTSEDAETETALPASTTIQISVEIPVTIVQQSDDETT
jgi:hypothetical protein